MPKRILGLSWKRPESNDEAADEDLLNVRTSSGTSSSSRTAEDEDVNTTNMSKSDDYSSRVSSSIQSSSVFSKSRQTHRTGASSMHTGSTQDSGAKLPGKRDAENMGKPLRVLEFGKLGSLKPVSEEEDPFVTSGAFLDEYSSGRTGNPTVTTSSKKDNSVLSMEHFDRALEGLDENLVGLMHDIHQNVTNVSKAVIQAAEFFKDFLPDVSAAKLPYRISCSKSPTLRRITKIVLHFVDNLLFSEVFNNSRAIIIKRFMSFLKKINIPLEESSELHALPHPRNFCIDAECDLPRKAKLASIMDKLAMTDSAKISDQDGAFIAPVLRGLDQSSAVLTLAFGLPDPQQEHFDMIKTLYSLFPDVHFYCVKDYITTCADVINPGTKAPQPMEATATSQFHPPYRLPSDVNSPPISMSISSQDSEKITGTLGGYVYPQIDENDTSLAQYSGSTFAMACAHVALAESHDYPYVSVPSAVLQKQYKTAILEEAQRYASKSVEKAAFDQEAARIDQNLDWQRENSFGQVVWGERSVIDQKLSDFTIIKVSSDVQCANFLGDDVSSMANPFLRFQNLYVKDKVLKLKPGMEVFKVGATTNFTRGQVNGSKLIYWADGKLRSSEFVVASPTPMFAAGGDSGAWILTKLTTRLGLGVVGMLHSYDGEQRQFGLFTPIVDILDRLHKVTGVSWDINRPK
ncbi:LAFA_0G04698g1_1 [Lachancea sp. 'fantastica']|nr:LAFA_0G04698g1_1 [Lachancea sp. 'fantastica']